MVARVSTERQGRRRASRAASLPFGSADDGATSAERVAHRVTPLTRVGGALPRPLAPRQGRAHDARRQLHRLVLVEGVRQGRARHLGDAADRLPLQRPRHARSTSRAAARAALRSPGTSTRRSGSVTRTCAERCCGSTARSSRAPATRSTPGRRSSRTPRRRTAYKSQRGRGGFVRSSWDEVSEIIAAAHVHTTSSYGPDRIVGFSPIPAMSTVSYAAGTRFLSLIGGVSLASTTGTRTCRRPRRRSGATRPTCRSPPTGGTRAT